MEEGKVTGANVSVKITDEFMQAAVADRPFVQQFPIDARAPMVSKTVSAKTLWGKIVHNAWKSAEPGVLFWDTILRESIPDCYADLGFQTVSTNPCGEIPLCPYDSCRLLSLNLYSYVVDPFTDHAHFDFDLFSRHAQLAQRIMDDIVDLEMEKIDLIMEKIKHDPQSEEVKHAEYHLWEKIREERTSYRRGDHRRRRHDCSHGAALRHARGYGLLRQRPPHIGPERLPRIGYDGAGAWSFWDL